MKRWSIMLGATAMASAALLSAPAQAYTAYQYYMQGQGDYVSSKARPPGGIQTFFGDTVYPSLPPGPGGYEDVPPPPGGYGYGYPPPDGY